MLQALEHLLIVQERDQRIKSYRKELLALPLQQKMLETELESLGGNLEKSKTRSKEIEIERKRLEVEVLAKRDQINRYKQQQLDTRKNEEYTALRHEIDTAEKAIVKIEDVELELMEENEQVKPGIQQAETLYADKKNFVQKQISENTDKHNTIKKRIEELEAERAKLVESVDEDLLELYDRLFKSKGDAAVVPLDHEVCMGCHMKATAQTAVRVKPNKEIIHCTQCGRILYHID